MMGRTIYGGKKYMMGVEARQGLQIFDQNIKLQCKMLNQTFNKFNVDNEMKKP